MEENGFRCKFDDDTYVLLALGKRNLVQTRTVLHRKHTYTL
jgi:hypothetical protein